jgi:hypothetical protein
MVMFTRMPAMAAGGLPVLALILTLLPALACPSARAQEDPGLQIQRQMQQNMQREQQRRELDYQDYLQRQHGEALRQEQNRQLQMQRDLRRSEDSLRPADNPDAARLRALQQRRDTEARQRQLDNERRQLDQQRLQLENDRRQFETRQRLDSLTKP